MKILISPSTDVIPKDKETVEKWNVDKILVYGADINDNLQELPFNESDLDITILIPTILNSINALAYDGANLALRILFKSICKRNKGINIVLMGCETAESFLKHYPYPNILKIPGISYSIFNYGIISESKQEQCPINQRKDYKNYIVNLGIGMPASFKSTHSLTNEWSLYKWNSFMDFNDTADGSRLNYLYFDYIKAVERINNVKYQKICNSQQLVQKLNALKARQSKILLIDDNIRWHHFFERFFDNSKISFESIGEIFKKMTADEVIQQIKKKVEEFSPDVILLDFRLIEDRDAEEKFDKISGTLVLQVLKGTFDNPGMAYGRQVVLFTATSRIENMMRLKQLNADGCILKEKPENYQGKEITKDAISKMIATLETAVERADFLITLNDKITELEAMPLSTMPELKVTIQTMSDSVRLITQNNELNEGVLKLTYLNLFSILESLKPSNIKINTYIQNNAPNDILNKWNNIDNIRNSLAHGDKEVKVDNIKQLLSVTLIKKWEIILCDYIIAFIKHKLTITNG